MSNRVLVSCVMVISTFTVCAAFITTKYIQRVSIVKNTTEAFEFLGEESNAFGHRLKFRNVSTKGITGYVVSVGKDSIIETDYNISEHVVAPQSTEEIDIPAPQVTVTSDGTQPEVNILAIVFDDQSIAGDAKEAARVLDRRKGLKTQISKILPLLQSLIDVNEDVSLNRIATVKEQIINLTEAQEKGASQYFRNGLHDAKEDALKEIEELEGPAKLQAKPDIKQHLKELHDQRLRRIARL